MISCARLVGVNRVSWREDCQKHAFDLAKGYLLAYKRIPLTMQKKYLFGLRKHTLHNRHNDVDAP